MKMLKLVSLSDDDNEVINENTDANENLEISEFEKIKNILFDNTNNDDENDKTYEEEKSENGKRKMMMM